MSAKNTLAWRSNIIHAAYPDDWDEKTDIWGIKIAYARKLRLYTQKNEDCQS